MQVEVRLGRGGERWGWEDRVALPPQACPAPAPSLPTAHGCDKTCQTSSCARTKRQSPELQTLRAGGREDTERLCTACCQATQALPQGQDGCSQLSCSITQNQAQPGLSRLPSRPGTKAWPLPSAPGYYRSSCQYCEGKRPRTHMGNMTGGRKIREKGHTDTCPLSPKP